MLKSIALAVALSAASLGAVASTTPGTQADGLSLSELQQMKFTTGMALGTENDLANKRLKSMRDAGLAVGAQNGYIATMNELREQINAEAGTWDALMPFKDIMRIASRGEKSNYYLPPVVFETDGVTAVSEDHRTIKVSDKYYVVYKEERLVTTPPDWREYLLIDIPVEASRPVGALLPKTSDEQQIWSDAVAEGWSAGILQANAEMTSRARALGTDIVGMVKYLQLRESNVMTSTYIASDRQGLVIGGGDMHIDQKTFSITDRAGFQSRTQAWIPMSLDPREGFRSKEELDLIKRNPL